MKPASLILAASLLAASCLAQHANSASAEGPAWEPPNIEWPEELPRATIPNPMITSLSVASTRIILEKTSLTDARKHLGGVVGHRGDAGESLSWLCLHGTDADGRWILWLESSEVDGGDVSGFQYRRLSAGTTVDSRCREFGNIRHAIKLPVPLRLGMTESQVRGVLGLPTVTQGHTLIFDHEQKHAIHDVNFTLSNTVAVVFADGIASAIQVWSVN
jgi:hypothetical protein